MIGGVYRFGMNSVCMCGGEQGLGTGKCAAWNCQNRNGVGGGDRVFGGGCTFGHESGNAYRGRGCKCEYGHIGSFGGVAIGTENRTMCSFRCQSGGAGDKYNSGCVVKFRSWHQSVSLFQGRHGHGNGKGGRDKWFGGSRRHEGGLLTGANLRMKGQKFLLYLLDPLLWRQLKGRYWRCAWCANQEGGGWSRWLTLIIKCSNKLFHGVNEDGEFSGFSFRGGSKGQSEWEQKRQCHEGQSVQRCGSVLRYMGHWESGLEI